MNSVSTKWQSEFILFNETKIKEINNKLHKKNNHDFKKMCFYWENTHIK